MKQNIKFIEAAMKEGSLLAFRLQDYEWNESIIGLVEEIKENAIIINEIDENGYFIGNTTIELNDVLKISYKDRYLERLEFIMKHNKSFDVKKQISIWQEGSKLIKYFKGLINNMDIVFFYFTDDHFEIGKLIEFDNDTFLVQHVTTEGEEDGKTVHFINQLSGIVINGLENQKITLLHKNKHLFSSHSR